MTSLAETERAFLADLLDEVGPDQPTQCEGWLTRDRAAHLVLRERSPAAAIGIVFGPLARHTRRVQDELAARPWPELVATLRQRSPLTFGPIDGAINTVEFFVHTEDVRRAQPDWQPRELDDRFEEEAARMLKARGRYFFRNAPTGVVLARPDGSRYLAKPGAPSITVTGPASELLLYAYGRAARVEISGPEGPPPEAPP